MFVERTIIDGIGIILPIFLLPVYQDHIFAPDTGSMYSEHHASYVSVEVRQLLFCFGLPMQAMGVF